MELTEMPDDKLRAEHEKALKRVQAARESKDGRKLRAARLAADAVQAVVNERFGAPPSQTIGG